MLLWDEQAAGDERGIHPSFVEWLWMRIVRRTPGEQAGILL